MTCNVALLNRFGAALATDSAVSQLRHLDSGEEVAKVFHGSRKLFRLHPDLPVGVLVHGRTDLMGRPWESFLGTFRATLPAGGFPALEDYARAFFRHVEVQPGLFPEALQSRDFAETVEAYVRQVLLSPLEKALPGKPSDDLKAARRAFQAILESDLAEWREVPELVGFGEAYGREVVRRYGLPPRTGWPEILGFPPGRSIAEGLEEVACHLYSKQWIWPGDRSGIVFAGYGREEFFPSLHAYQAGTVARDRLRLFPERTQATSDRQEALVCPFGQTEAIDLFFQGIPDGILAHLRDALHEAVPADRAEGILEELSGLIQRTEWEPLFSAIAGMPGGELAQLAGTLVEFAALRSHLSAGAETVGGPVTVALLTKGEGFTWIRQTGPGHPTPGFPTPVNGRFS